MEFEVCVLLCCFMESGAGSKTVTLRARSRTPVGRKKRSYYIVLKGKTLGFIERKEEAKESVSEGDGAYYLCAESSAQAVEIFLTYGAQTVQQRWYSTTKHMLHEVIASTWKKNGQTH